VGRVETRHLMGLRGKMTGSILTLVGFMLSPLSWWNDAFVNLPLALAFAWIISLFYRPAFEISLVMGYWLTNVAGLVLMHKGAQSLAAKTPNIYSRRELIKDVVISLVYTALILLLLKFGVLKPIKEYISGA